MKPKQVTFLLVVFLLYLGALSAQVTPPYALMPVPRQCFWAPGGVPLSGGFLYTYLSGTTTPQKTYSDASGMYPNQNPVNLDANGCAVIFLAPVAYTVTATDASNVQQWSVPNVSDVGQLLYARAVVVNPTGGALQAIAGPLGANFFQGLTPHTTSPGVRVALLDPFTVRDTANPPSDQTTPPATAGQIYTVPDPGTQSSNYVLSPAAPDWQLSTPYLLAAQIQPSMNNPCLFTFTVSTAGTSAATAPIFSTLPCSSSAATVSDNGVVWTSNGVVTPGNNLDCTKTGINCTRNAYSWFEAAACNNATGALGWDTFGTNAPNPLCITGAHIQKGVMAFPSAATRLQEATGTGAAAGTCTTTYPAATITGHLLEVEIGVDGGKTVASVSDGTNSYTKAVNATSGNYDVEIWYYNGSSTAMAAGSTLTVTLSASANCTLNWKEYADILTSGALDQTAVNGSSGTTVFTGTTSGTSQNTELLIGAMVASGAPSVTAANGWTQHLIVSQSTNVTVDSSAMIQQATGTRSTSFGLGASSTWAGAIATFKVNVGATVTAQRSWGLPPFYLSSVPVNSTIKWLTPGLQLHGVADAVLGAALVCTADGATDDPVFNTASTANVAIPVGGTNPVTTTSLTGLTATGCAGSTLMHYQIQRLRYNASDTYEGYIYVTGAGLQYGINQ